MQRTATIKPATMKAVVTTGNGGYDRLVWREVPVPEIGPGEVLLRVLAAGVNNTDINTRLGWYSSPEKPDGGWNIATPFPFIQGTDCCGRVVEAAQDVDPALVGRRVLVRACMRPQGFGSMETLWMGSDFDGAFAEYVKVPAAEVFAVHCNWTDAELASIPCAYATAENMLHRSRAAAGDPRCPASGHTTSSPAPAAGALRSRETAARTESRPVRRAWRSQHGPHLRVPGTHGAAPADPGTLGNGQHTYLARHLPRGTSGAGRQRPARRRGQPGGPAAHRTDRTCGYPARADPRLRTPV
jgi:hypothetical protein